jgi:hypothetical protein
MQSRKELWQKGHDKSKKINVMRGEKISFWERSGVNIVLGPKYRPLLIL